MKGGYVGGGGCGLEEPEGWQLGMPGLIVPSLQVNLMNGAWPEAEGNGIVYLKVPVNVLGKK
jgi:hypothetical protein